MILQIFTEYLPHVSASMLAIRYSSEQDRKIPHDVFILERFNGLEKPSHSKNNWKILKITKITENKITKFYIQNIHNCAK